MKTTNYLIIVIFLLVISNVYFFLRWDSLNSMINAGNGNLHVAHNWNAQGTIYSENWLRNGKRRMEAHDKNLDNLWEYVRLYDYFGKLQLESYDRDFDGVFEKEIAYNGVDQLKMIYIDTNQDCRPDSLISWLKDETSMIWIDRDYDNCWDSVIVKDKNDNVLNRFSEVELRALYKTPKSSVDQ